MNPHEQLFLRLVDHNEYHIDADGRIWKPDGGKWKRAEKLGRYKQVMFREGKGEPWHYVYAHRVVALFHLGDIPDGYEINHKDGKKHNNHPANLEIVTKSQNATHSVRVLRKNRGECHGMSKITDEIARTIRRLCCTDMPRKDIAARFGVHPSCVSHIKARRTWKHVT